MNFAILADGIEVGDRTTLLDHLKGEANARAKARPGVVFEVVAVYHQAMQPKGIAVTSTAGGVAFDVELRRIRRSRGISRRVFLAAEKEREQTGCDWERAYRVAAGEEIARLEERIEALEARL